MNTCYFSLLLKTNLEYVMPVSSILKGLLRLWKLFEYFFLVIFINLFRRCFLVLCSPCDIVIDVKENYRKNAICFAFKPLRCSQWNRRDWDIYRNSYSTGRKYSMVERDKYSQPRNKVAQSFCLQKSRMCRHGRKFIRNRRMEFLWTLITVFISVFFLLLSPSVPPSFSSSLCLSSLLPFHFLSLLKA